MTLKWALNHLKLVELHHCVVTLMKPSDKVVSRPWSMMFIMASASKNPFEASVSENDEATSYHMFLNRVVLVHEKNAT
jgi:hypothetical protein